MGEKMKKQLIRFEHAIYTSIINSYGFQASSKGIKKYWKTELEKRCEYTHSKTLNLNNPDHIKKLPEIFRFYSIPDEKANYAFFLSRTSYGKQDKSHRMVSITHIVKIEEKLFYSSKIIPVILYKIIPWIKFFTGNPGDELPLLEVDMNDYEQEVNNLKQWDILETNINEIERMSYILLNAEITDKRSFFIYQSNHTEQLFNQLSLCFYTLPAFAIKKLSFTINDYYPPKATFNLILFDPKFPVNSAQNYNDLSFFFPLDTNSEYSNPVRLEAVTYLVSYLKTNNFSELSKIKDRMNIFTDWELTPENFQIVFAFTFHVLKIKELDDLPSYPSSFSAWIDIVKAFQHKKGKDGLQKQLFIECCEKWLLNEPDTIITELKPEIIIEIFTQWFLLLDDQVVNSQLFNKWIDITKAFQSKKGKMTVQRQLFLEFFEKKLFKEPESIVPNIKSKVLVDIFTQWILLLDNQRFTPQFKQFLLVLFSNLIIYKNWSENDLFKEKITHLILKTFQSENQYIELLKILGELYSKMDRNNQYIFRIIEPIFFNNPNAIIRTYFNKYLFDLAFAKE